MKSLFVLIIIAALNTPAYASPHSETQDLKNAMAQCPAAKRLLDKVKAFFAREGTTLKLKLKQGGEWSKVSHAFCEPETGLIQIKTDCSFNDKLHALVFELANLSQSDLFDKIDPAKLSREEYTYQIEELEYRTEKIHDDVVSTCKATSDWNKGIPEYNNKDPFPTHWAIRARNSLHADEVRKRYDALKQAERAQKRESAFNEGFRDSRNPFDRLAKELGGFGKFRF